MKWSTVSMIKRKAYDCDLCGAYEGECQCIHGICNRCGEDVSSRRLLEEHGLCGVCLDKLTDDPPDYREY